MNKFLCLIVIFLSTPLISGMEKRPRPAYPKKSQAMVQAIEDEKNKRTKNNKRKREQSDEEGVNARLEILAKQIEECDQYKLTNEVKRPRLMEKSSQQIINTNPSMAIRQQTNNTSPTPHQGTPCVKTVKTPASLSLTLAPLSYGTTPRKTTYGIPICDALELAELIKAKRSKQNYQDIRSFLQKNSHIIKSSHSSAAAKKDPYNHTLRYLPEGRLLIEALEGKKTEFLDENGNTITPEDMKFSYANTELLKELLLKKVKKLYDDAIKKKKTTNNSSKK